MPRRIVVTTILAIVWASRLAYTQSDSLSKHVYYVEIETDKGRYMQTGFRMAGQIGIVTALHGVTLANRIGAKNKHNHVLDDLKVTKVNIAKDLALLSSPQLNNYAGILYRADVKVSAKEELYALGFPLTIAYHKQPVHAGAPVRKPLKDFIPANSQRLFRKRNSPSAELNVLNIAGHLYPGHSGAPIINADGYLVGVGNGGLMGGAADISWAIPADEISWDEITTPGVTEELENLSWFNARLLFEMRRIRGHLRDTKHNILAIGFGFGYKGGDHVTLGNVPSEVRTIPPHPDDVRDRFNEILDPNIPDNYLIRENSVRVDLGHRTGIDLRLKLWGVVNIGIRSSAIRESEALLGQNLFRKEYITPNPGDPVGGSALIFYAVKGKERQFFDANSFSIPISLTYPVFFVGRDRGIILRIIGGTNILLPERIEIEAEKGWDRFGERESEDPQDLGDLKEIEWFGGIHLEGAPTKSIRLGIEFTLVYTDYQEDFKVPLSLQLENKVRPSFRINLTKLLKL